MRENETMTADCWCGEPHPENPSTFDTAWRNLWHLVLTELKIPQLAERLSRRIK